MWPRGCIPSLGRFLPSHTAIENSPNVETCFSWDSHRDSLHHLQSPLRCFVLVVIMGSHRPRQTVKEAIVVSLCHHCLFLNTNPQNKKVQLTSIDNGSPRHLMKNLWCFFQQLCNTISIKQVPKIARTRPKWKKSIESSFGGDSPFSKTLPGAPNCRELANPRNFFFDIDKGHLKTVSSNVLPQPSVKFLMVIIWEDSLLWDSPGTLRQAPEMEGTLRVLISIQCRCNLTSKGCLCHGKQGTSESISPWKRIIIFQTIPGFRALFGRILVRTGTVQHFFRKIAINCLPSNCGLFTCRRQSLISGCNDLFSFTRLAFDASFNGPSSCPFNSFRSRFVGIYALGRWLLSGRVNHMCVKMWTWK